MLDVIEGMIRAKKIKYLYLSLTKKRVKTDISDLHLPFLDCCLLQYIKRINLICAIYFLLGHLLFAAGN
jgi:hypothetical protein